MGNSPSRGRIIVALLFFLKQGDALKTPLYRNQGLRQCLRYKTSYLKRQPIEHRYSASSNDNDSEGPSFPNPPPSSPAVSPLYFSMVGNTSSTFTSREKETSRQGKRSKVAPTIDSDLLRFLSSQKNIPIITATEELDTNKDFNENNIDKSKSKSVISSKTELNGNELQSTISTSNDKKRVEFDQVSQKPEWIDQFRAEKVTQTLITYGSLREEARAAGIAVQNLAYMRMRKRSVNRFLKDRDELWATYKLISATAPLSFGKVGNAGVQFSGGFQLTENRTDVSLHDELPINDNVDKVLTFLLESGLTATDCAALLTHTPSVAMMRAKSYVEKANGKSEKSSDGATLEDTFERAYSGLLFNTLKLRKYDARKVLRTCPGLLTKRGSIGGEKIIQLLSSLGASPKSLARDKRFLPALLSRSPSSLFRLVAFLSSAVIRLPVRSIGPLIRNPDCIDLLDAACPLPTSSDKLESTSLDILPQPPKGIQMRKNIDETYKHMKETAEALRHELGVLNVGKLVLAYPGVLLLEPSTQIFPVADFLYNEIGLSEIGVPQVLQSFPSLLKTDVKQMRETVTYLLELEVSEQSIEKIFRAFPKILTFDKETQMKPVVEFLQEIGVVNIGRFVTRLPAILGYSVEDELKPKWGYLTQVCGFDYFEVVRFPAYFSYPLERITSRYEYLGSKRIPLRLVSVDTVLRYGDNEFATNVAGDKDNGNSFKQYIRERRGRKQTSKQNNNGNDRLNKSKRNGANARNSSKPAN